MSAATEVRTGAKSVVPSWLRGPGMGASVIVAAISAFFGAALVLATDYIGVLLKSDSYIGDSSMLAAVVAVLGWVMIGVAMYVAAIVTANTFATVVAGRTRSIALMRLIGATAASERRRIANQGLGVGALGAVIGAVLACIAVRIGVELLSDAGTTAPGFTPAQWSVLVPAVAVALTTWAAAWAGSRRVLAVTPLEAIGGSVEASREQIARRTGRHIFAAILLASGVLLLALGVVLGLLSPLAVIVAFFGGVLSFTGLALGATLVMPPVLRVVGRLFGRSATARMAAENALRYPERSSRMAIGVVMGVTLVTMFAVAFGSIRAMLERVAGGEMPAELGSVLDSFTAIMMSLVGVSAVIAAVGLVNLLTLGILQRRRELGLLRALGLTGRQVRLMVLIEAAHVTIAAVGLGLVLGIGYGWVAAQSVLGSVSGLTTGVGIGIVVPALPLVPLLVIVVAAAVLTLAAAVWPTRIATRVGPIQALAA